jgi:hypothetical protein
MRVGVPKVDEELTEKCEVFNLSNVSFITALNSLSPESFD